MRKPVSAICEQQRRRSACASMQSLASFCGCTGLFVSYLVKNPTDRFSRDMAQMKVILISLCSLTISCLVFSFVLAKWTSPFSFLGVSGAFLVIRNSCMHMSLVMRKPVLGVCDRGRLKLACATTEARQRLELLDIETRGLILLFRQQTRKVLIRLYGCVGWSAPLFIYSINRFSHNMAHTVLNLIILQCLIEFYTTVTTCQGPIYGALGMKV